MTERPTTVVGDTGTNGHQTIDPQWLEKQRRAIDMAEDDDEPLTDEEIASIERGWEQYRNGQTYSFDEVFADLDDETHP